MLRLQVTQTQRSQLLNICQLVNTDISSSLLSSSSSSSSSSSLKCNAGGMTMDSEVSTAAQRQYTSTVVTCNGDQPFQ